MAQKIAAPAETLRRLAGSVSRAAVQQEDAGNHRNAESCRIAAEVAYDAAAGLSSNLVAIDAKHAATIAAFADASHPYKPGLVTMLKHQNKW